MNKLRRKSIDRIKLINHTRVSDESEIEELYSFGDVLGKGAFGVVRLLTHTKTDKKYAMKLMDKSKAGSGAVKQLEREVTILKMVNHKYIVSLHEIFETSKRMFIVMECCDGGELIHYVQAQPEGRLNEEDARTVILRLSSAIAYLHDRDIVHRDLKLENILLSTEDPDDHLNIKVTDFGLSEIKGKDSMMQTMCGTPIYMAPEVIDNLGYSQQCDVWSIGIIMFYTISGNFPFVANDEEALYDAILAADVQFTNNPWSNISSSAKGLISQMLKKDPAHRCTCKEIHGHPWTTGKTGDDNQPLPTVLEMMRAYNIEQKFIANVNRVIEMNRKKKREKFMAIYLGTPDPSNNPSNTTTIDGDCDHLQIDEETKSAASSAKASPTTRKHLTVTPQTPKRTANQSKKSQMLDTNRKSSSSVTSPISSSRKPPPPLKQSLSDNTVLRTEGKSKLSPKSTPSPKALANGKTAVFVRKASTRLHPSKAAQ